MHRRVDALDRALHAVGDDAHDAGEPAAAREHAALHVDGVGAARVVQPPALRRVVHERVRCRGRSRRARRATPSARALPQRRAVLVDDARRVEHVADAQPVVQRACEPERDDAARPGTPFAARTPTRTVRRPSRFATRSSAVVAQAKVSPSASTPCSARSPSGSSTTRRPRTARSRSGCRSARSAGRCPGRTSPSPCLRAAPRTSGRSRR